METRVKNLEEIYKNKVSNIAVFLGNGSSINNITDSQWKKIGETDTWVVNNWVYHPFIPKFYHVEVKSIDSNIMKSRLLDKIENYNTTNFIIDKNRSMTLDVVSGQKNIYLYEIRDMINNKGRSKYNPLVTYKHEDSYNPNVIKAFNLSSSLVIVLDIMLRFGYEKIIFFGVDLYNSKYFWTDRHEYGKTHCRFNKDHKKNKTISDPHSTSHIKDFIVWFSKEWMNKIGTNVFVGHTDTSLYPDLNYLNIEEEI
jgi:hypothetical protein